MNYAAIFDINAIRNTINKTYYQNIGSLDIDHSTHATQSVCHKSSYMFCLRIFSIQIIQYMKFVMKYFEELTIYCPNPNISKMHCLTFKIDSIVYAIKLLNALINTKYLSMHSISGNLNHREYFHLKYHTPVANIFYLLICIERFNFSRNIFKLLCTPCKLIHKIAQLFVC